jgi:hypothetical protein
VSAGVFWRLEVARKLRRSSVFEVFEESSGRLIPSKYSREGREQILVQKVKFFRGFRGKKLNGRNSLRRTHETTRTIGSTEAARWIRADEPITLVPRFNVGR